MSHCNNASIFNDLSKHDLNHFASEAGIKWIRYKVAFDIRWDTSKPIINCGSFSKYQMLKKTSSQFKRCGRGRSVMYLFKCQNLNQIFFSTHKETLVCLVYQFSVDSQWQQIYAVCLIFKGFFCTQKLEYLNVNGFIFVLIQNFQ